MLEISQLDVFYGDLQALWDVSISIDAGQIVALVGSNGALAVWTVCRHIVLLRVASAWSRKAEGYFQV